MIKFCILQFLYSCSSDWRWWVLPHSLSLIKFWTSLTEEEGRKSGFFFDSLPLKKVAESWRWSFCNAANADLFVCVVPARHVIEVTLRMCVILLSNRVARRDTGAFLGIRLAMWRFSTSLFLLFVLMATALDEPNAWGYKSDIEIYFSQLLCGLQWGLLFVVLSERKGGGSAMIIWAVIEALTYMHLGYLWVKNTGSHPINAACDKFSLSSGTLHNWMNCGWHRE